MRPDPGRQRPPRPPMLRRWLHAVVSKNGFAHWLAVLLAAIVAGFGLGLLMFAPLQPPPALSSAAPAETRPIIPVETASIAAIDARRGDGTAVFRLDVAPGVLVLDFPDLHPQALMLNRVAALTEKAAMPHDRILPEPELWDRIRKTGKEPDRYYYGHDYRAADLARFFRLAEAQHMPLNPFETWLRDLLDQEGWLRDGANGALISIPGPAGDIDATVRTVIFRHELSHAVYFTDPTYVALTKSLWKDKLTEDERAAMRTFLGEDGYDKANEDLMANEGQAYLIHTRDPRYFAPSMIGMTEARAAELRAKFIDAIAEPWLRDSALGLAPVSVGTSSGPEHP